MATKKAGKAKGIPNKLVSGNGQKQDSFEMTSKGYTKCAGFKGGPKGG